MNENQQDQDMSTQDQQNAGQPDQNQIRDEYSPDLYDELDFPTREDQQVQDKPQQRNADEGTQQPQDEEDM